MNMITFESSHGYIKSDPDGVVTEVHTHCDCTDGCIHKIMKMDLVEMYTWLRRYGHHDPERKDFDILDCGYWDSYGDYTPASTTHRYEIYTNGQNCLISNL